MQPKKSAWLRIGGSQGILAPVAGLVFISLAIATYPTFSWTNNALSDLGIVPGVTSTLFNFGLYLSGLFSVIFAVGLYRFLDEHAIGKVGSIIFVAASLALEGIGAFPENMRPFHYIFSVAFFVLMPIALLVIATYFLKIRQKQMATFTLLAAFIAAVPWVLQFTVPYVSGVAIPEAISAVAGSVWTVVLGYKMLKEGSGAKSS